MIDLDYKVCDWLMEFNVKLDKIWQARSARHLKTVVNLLEPQHSLSGSPKDVLFIIVIKNSQFYNIC